MLYRLGVRTANQKPKTLWAGDCPDECGQPGIMRDAICVPRTRKYGTQRSLRTVHGTQNHLLPINDGILEANRFFSHKRNSNRLPDHMSPTKYLLKPFLPDGRINWSVPMPKRGPACVALGKRSAHGKMRKFAWIRARSSAGSRFLSGRRGQGVPQPAVGSGSRSHSMDPHAGARPVLP